MKIAIIFSTSLLASLATYSQTPVGNFIGKYADAGTITTLELHADSTFSLKTPDYVFPYKYTSYQCKGVWTASQNIITLNPEKEKRKPTMQLVEKTTGDADSITIKINYSIETYENESLVNKEQADFRLLTIYINKRHNYRNVVHAPVHRICVFTPRVKKQVITDSSNTIKFAKQQVNRLGIYTYGFDDVIELTALNPASNYFEINIIQPVDKERIPRSKTVIIKGNNAYYYEINGKVNTSGFLAALKKQVKI